MKDIAISTIKGDASTRLYFRVRVKKKSFVVCHDSSMKNNSNYAFMDVHHIFDKSKVSLPKILDICYTTKLLLQEDLGDVTNRIFKMIEFQKEELAQKKAKIEALEKENLQLQQRVRVFNSNPPILIVWNMNLTAHAGRQTRS